MLTTKSAVELSSVKVSKTLLTRLLGQLYDVCGILAPIRVSLLSLFAKVCQVLKDWKSHLPSDSELAVATLGVLEELRLEFPLIWPMECCSIPENSVLQRIVIVFRCITRHLCICDLFRYPESGQFQNLFILVIKLFLEACKHV